MTKLLIQHGPAKGQKIGTALADKNADGAIFSLREEKIESIYSYVSASSLLNLDNTFIDPQFYYSTYDSGNLKNLENSLNFPIDVSRRDMRTKDERIYSYFDAYAENLNGKINSILTPGFSIDAIDWKFDSTLDIYKYFKDKNEFEHHYMSMMISSKMFHSKNDIDEILLDISDETESYDKNGIYLIVNYTDDNDSNYENIDSETLSNILYFVYMLKKKGFNVIVGYTFINSILFAMLDCEYVSSGWFNNLRKFTNAKFESIDNFGRRKKKFFSLPLLSYINLEIIRELKSFYNVDNIKSATKCDDIAFDDIDQVSFVDLEHQFWQAEHIIINEINGKESIEEKIKLVKKKIISSISISEEIMNQIPNEFGELKSMIKTNTSHLKEWLFAIDLFTKKASILAY